MYISERNKHEEVQKVQNTKQTLWMKTLINQPKSVAGPGLVNTEGKGQSRARFV